MKSESPTINVACYVRTCSLVAPVDSTLRTLEGLDADGVIDGFTVDAWPAEVRLGEGPTASDVPAVFERFEAWAVRRDVSIRPPFAVQTRHSEITGETREVLVTPVQCLAVVVNGLLREVFPHSTDPTGGGDTYTLRDAIGLLEKREIRASGGDQPPGPPPDQTPRAEVDSPGAGTSRRQGGS